MKPNHPKHFLLWPAAILAAIFLTSCFDHDSAVDPRGSHSTLTAAAYIGNPPVIISEIYSANADYKDEFGGDPGWAEFYNPADTAVNLDEYCLTNDANNTPRRWCFGDVVVPPRGYVTVFLSGRDLPDLYPPSDSIDILRSAVGVTTWSDSLNRPTAGSSAAYAQFTSNPPRFSGTLKARQNTAAPRPGQMAIGFTSAIATLILKGQDTTDVVDMSRTNQVLLRGFVNKDQQLEIRFPHIGAPDDLAWPAVITGTGVENDLYAIELPPTANGFPDWPNIHSIRFSNPLTFRGTIEFNFNSIVAHRRSSNVHVSWSLSNSGGRLFLTDSDGNIRDSVAYPAGTIGLSYARNRETLAWAHSSPPTPNGANSAVTFDGGKTGPPPTTGIPNSGHYADAQSFVIPQGSDGAVIACDVTGALPTKDSPLKSGSTVDVTKTSVMRCAQFKEGAYPSDPIMRTYIIGRLPDLPIVSIAVDPRDMFDNTVGLYSRGPNANRDFPHYGANFWKETELPVQIEFFESSMRPGWSHNAGLRIFGNWSRGNDKKSVVITFREAYGAGRLNYRLFPERPDLTRFKHFILRNNGNNYGQDYIRDILMTSLTEGLGIEYQLGRPAIVYYNGEYYGIHDLRERANGDYFETRYDIAQDFVDLVKASGEISEGTDWDYQNVLRWLEGLNGLSDDNLRQLDERIDVDNYTYQFMCRMYYHDRDWPGNNMKRWRTHSPPSRWKFIMYDTDHGWGGAGRWNQTNVNTFNFVTAENGPVSNREDWPNPPSSTFLFRKLLQNNGYKNSFINRFSLLIATYFTQDRVNARIDALMAPIESEIPYDRERWTLSATTQKTAMDSIRNFNGNRRTLMQNEMAQFFNLSGGANFTISVGSGGGGKVLVHNMEVMNGSATFRAYPAAPIVLTAVPNGGFEFDRWSDNNGGAERTYTVPSGQASSLQAIFKPAPVSVRERERVVPGM